MQISAAIFSSRPRRNADVRNLRWLWYSLALLLAVGPSMLYPSFAVFGAQPELLTLMVVWHGLHGSPQGRYWPAMLVGFARDVFSAGPLGLYTIGYGVLHRLLTAARGVIGREGAVIQTVIAGVCVLALILGAHGVLVLQGAGAGWVAAAQVAGVTAAVTAPIMPLLHLLLVAALSKLGAEQDNADNWSV